MDLVVNGVDIIGLADTDTVLADDTPFGFNVFTSNTFIGIPLLVVVRTVPVLPDGFAIMNCCGLNPNWAALDCILVDGFIRMFVGTNDTKEIEQIGYK